MNRNEMKIAVLGTGMVGRALAGRLAGLGHRVVIGTRDVERTLARSEPGCMGTPPYVEWQRLNPNIELVSFAEAGSFAEIVVNATFGMNSLAALEAVGADNLAGKILLDLAIPLDLSEGLPPKLLIASTDSLGEQIQRAFPETRVVKSLHTVFFEVMIDPARVPGHHIMFISGNDAEAKATVELLLRQFGWAADAIIDLGGIKAARSTEMYSQLYFNLVGVFGGSFDFSIAVVRTLAPRVGTSADDTQITR